MFGQSLVMAELGRAQRASSAADLVLALGSSLVVTPAADVPLFGVRRGAPYVIVNRGDTPHDRLATLRIDDDVSEILPRAVAVLLA
jgi:NAD-dependent deacetylase